MSKCNYEIISLCDIKEFNKEIALLKNVPWSQLTLPETLNIPKNKSPIKSIYKIYVKVKIDSLKIIETPKTSVSNAEGLFLTGKKLSINGIICEKIIYNCCYPNNSLSSIQFNIPFSTYIVINHDVNIHTDKFNVKTCIENIFVTPLSEKTLFQSITLFLFAKRVCIESVPVKQNPQIIYDRIIITNNKNKKVAILTFDLQNKMLIIESTGELTSNDLTLDEYFSLTLRSSNNFIKAFSSLQSNVDAKNFYDDLNNKSFEFTDSIELKYINNLTVFITNLENKTYKFNPISEQEHEGIQFFYITERGLISNIY